MFTNPKFPTGARILIVEDYYALAGMLYHMLCTSGYRVEIAFAVQDARDVLRNRKFDILISEINLLDGHGREVLKEMKMRGPVRSIALTGKNSPEGRATIEAAGFDRVLEKPASFNDLLAMVREIEPTGNIQQPTAPSRTASYAEIDPGKSHRHRNFGLRI